MNCNCEFFFGWWLFTIILGWAYTIVSAVRIFRARPRSNRDEERP